MSMDVKTPAIEVLQQEGGPLHAKDTAEQTMATELWKSGGKTPAATVIFRLKHEKKCAFKLVG